MPDVAYVSYDRLRPLTDEQAEEPPFAPDVAAEVRSPSHRRGLAAKKVRQYLAHGGVLVLDVDPYARAIRAHARDAAGPASYRLGERFNSESLPWLQSDVDELFVNIDIPR